jgi:hypothetical protein
MSSVPCFLKRFLIVPAALLAVPVLRGMSAEAKVRVENYSKAGLWSIRAVFRDPGPFDHCSANARYKSGTTVSIIAYRSGNWRLWFAHPSWPDRGSQRFPAQLEVDGRTVLERDGNFKGRNAYIDLGGDINKVKALMRGKRMSVVTPSGTSRFSLNGTFRATVEAARCWKANYQTGGSRAFGSTNNGGGSGGAFGGNAPAPNPKITQLSRANTLELTTRYLAKSKQAYSILPAEQNTLKHFPVNWKYGGGGNGGMRVFTNADVAVDKLLATLLSDQAKYCSGRDASQREDVRTVQGRRMVRARCVCETDNGSVLNITYKVAELGQQMVMMVMEVQSAAGSGSRTSGNPPARVGFACRARRNCSSVPPGDAGPENAGRHRVVRPLTKTPAGGHRRAFLFKSEERSDLSRPPPSGSIRRHASGRSPC